MAVRGTMAGRPLKTEVKESIPSAHPSRQTTAMRAHAHAIKIGKPALTGMVETRLSDGGWDRVGMFRHHSRNAYAGAQASGGRACCRHGRTGTAVPQASAVVGAATAWVCVLAAGTMWRSSVLRVESPMARQNSRRWAARLRCLDGISDSGLR